MNLVIIGAGYVGLTTGACFASLGNSVCCVDIDEERVRDLERGIIPIYEPGLEDLVAASREKGLLGFSSDIAAVVPGADLVFIAVGTPSGKDGDIDLAFVESAARSIAPHLRPQAVVVVKSTVVAGTAKHVADIIATTRGRDHISVASNPEFLREGSAISDFLNADRVVVGADDRRAAEALKALYRPLTDRGVPFISTTTTDAELIKYAANAFLALKIGFINDVANICEGAGGDVTAVAAAIGLDRRIGEAFLQPGPGFGGSCFPKDTRAFAATGRRYKARQALIETLIERNEDRKADMAERILSALGPQRRGKRVALLGMAFKAGTDDVRESAALTIAPILQKAGVIVCGHDPKAMATARQALGDTVEWCPNIEDAVSGADSVAILTEWDDYRNLDLGRLARLMDGRHLFDFRNLYAPQNVTRNGLVHHSLGRPVTQPADPTPSRAGSVRNPAWLDVAAAPR